MGDDEKAKPVAVLTIHRGAALTGHGVNALCTWLIAQAERLRCAEHLNDKPRYTSRLVAKKTTYRKGS